MRRQARFEQQGGRGGPHGACDWYVSFSFCCAAIALSSDHRTFVLAISFFDRAKGSASTESPETLLADMQPLVNRFPRCLSSVFLIRFLVGQLAEALLSLANLTADEDAREALYARAKAEGGEAVARDLGPSPTRTPTADVRMDES